MTAPEQRFYDIVAEEIRSRSVADGVWVRSFSEADGDDAKARALYIRYRVEQLKGEEAAARQAATRREQEDRVTEKHEVRREREREVEALHQRSLTTSEKRFRAHLDSTAILRA